MSAGWPAVAPVGDRVGLDGPLVGAGSGAGWLPCRRWVAGGVGAGGRGGGGGDGAAFRGELVVAGMGVWAAGLAALAGTDADRMVLPKRLVYLTLAGTLGGLTVAAGAAGAWGRLGWAVAAAVVAEGLFAVWALAVPGALGFGDVRLVGLAGLGLGWSAPTLVPVGLLGGRGRGGGGGRGPGGGWSGRLGRAGCRSARSWRWARW